MSAVRNAGGELTPTALGGPFFEELEVGQAFEHAPRITLDSGSAAVRQGLVGDRMRLVLDEPLAEAVTSEQRPLAHPGLAWDVAIGQSTVVTQRVIANLLYRGFRFHRAPHLGDTLATTTTVTALKQNSTKDGRATGLAMLNSETTDQEGRPVLSMYRCAMLPLSSPELETGHSTDMHALGDELTLPADLGWTAEVIGGWNLEPLRSGTPEPHFSDLEAGMSWEISGADSVDGATALTRLSLNLAMAHVGGEGSGGPLVYGGHTIGIALAQVTRALPALAYVVGWHDCSHLGPVRQGDQLRTRLEVESAEALERAGGLLELRAITSAERSGEPVDVLDWRFVAVAA